MNFILNEAICGLEGRGLLRAHDLASREELGAAGVTCRWDGLGHRGVWLTRVGGLPLASAVESHFSDPGSQAWGFSTRRC